MFYAVILTFHRVYKAVINSSLFISYEFIKSFTILDMNENLGRAQRGQQSPGVLGLLSAGSMPN
ncbi:MAG TPA: hypothetical protein DEP47_08360 [Chloroflexi bacterium]|nr:hypothetical protein [Chloroflexota bacterium]